VIPRDSHILQAGDVKRLSEQNQRVLARLQRGPAHRRELQDIACNITARITDLRDAGYTIPTPVKSVYRLQNDDERLVAPACDLPHQDGQDLREVRTETAPSDVHDLNSWGLR
jgi:hypothetical protein